MSLAQAFQSGVNLPKQKQKVIGYDREHRASFAGKPEDYMREILGIDLLTEDQVKILEAIEKGRKILIKASNAVGKTHLISAYGVYWIDAIGAQLGVHGEPEGAMWILSHPNADGAFETIWSSALLHIRNAQRLGYEMPGAKEMSHLSVKWRIRDDWKIEAISPPKRAGEEQQHGGAGRHHKNLLITFDEGPGIDNARYRAADGMASSGKMNKFVTIGNPTENIGEFPLRAKDPAYRVVSISGFNHPNVIERKAVVEGAKSHVDLDLKVLSWCERLGPYPDVQPDPARFDFVYYLHPFVGTENQDAIPDPLPNEVINPKTGRAFLGHRDGQPIVFRPDHRFLSSEMGEFPLESFHDLFSLAHIEAGIKDWYGYKVFFVGQNCLLTEQQGYHIAGVDPAEEGGDTPVLTLGWKYKTMAGEIRWRVGSIHELPRGLPDALASSIFYLGGQSPEYVVDVIGVGSGTESILRSVYACRTYRFKSSYQAESKIVKVVGTLSGNPEQIVAELREPEFGNTRAAAYYRAAQLVAKGVVDIPDNNLLKQELLNTKTIIRKGKMYIVEKKEIKKVIGRSPDRADAFVMQLFENRDRAIAGVFSNPLYQQVQTTEPQDYSFYSTRRETNV